MAVLSNSSWYGYGSGIAYFPHKIASILLDKPYQKSKMSAAKLHTYEGVYKADKGQTRTISMEGEELFLVQDGGHLSPIYHKNKNSFYVEDSYETLSFTSNEKGVTGLKISLGRPLYFEKTNIPLPKKSIYRALRTVSLQNADEAIDLYYSLKAKNPSNYNFENEGELNRLGYYLLSQGLNHSAIKIFSLLIEEFPKSANAYDSLAEAYYHQNMLDESARNYKLSLELNPDNSNARRMLKTMLQVKNK